MKRRPHIYPLTSLRLFFALAVFFHHCYFLTQTGDPLLAGLYYRVFSEGYIGVSFFFILSGFILAYTYEQPLTAGRTDRRAFYLARFARIYPLHLVTLLLVVPITTGGLGGLLSGRELPTFLYHLTLTHALVTDPHVYQGYNSSSWSISTEWWFYLAFPVLIAALAALRRRCGRWMYATGLLVLLVPVAFYRVPDALHHALFYISPVFRIADFFLGLLLYYAYTDWRRGRSLSYRAYTGLETGALLLLLAFFAAFPLVPAVWRYSAYYWLPMSAVIFAFAYRGGWWSERLSARWLVLGGEISFALYMVHRPVMWYYVGFKNRVFDPGNAYVDVVVLLCGSLLAAYLLHVYVERPLVRWIKTRGRPLTPLAP